MHLETAGEGPTNQVLQNHKSIASAKSIAVEFFYFAAVLLLDWLVDDVFSFYMCVYIELLKWKKKEVAHVTNNHSQVFQEFHMQSFNANAHESKWCSQTRCIHISAV